VAAGSAQPIFYYDLGSPGCYLVAERITAAFPVVPEWEPVLGSELGDAADPDRAAIERAAAAQSIQPLRWPGIWPPDSRVAMLAATYAKRVGRGVAFSLAAFRQTFAGGRDLGDQDTVLIAGAACEMHPTALLKAIALRSTAESLAVAVDRARRAGVRSLPAIQVGEALFTGARAVEQGASALGTMQV
jgi:2-hydroxychromene-2-carboxylate isomerase